MNRSALALFALPIVFSCGVEDLNQPPGPVGGSSAVAGTSSTTAGSTAVSGSSAGGTGGTGTSTAGSTATGGSGGGTGGSATAGSDSGGGGMGGAPAGGTAGAAVGGSSGSGGSAGGSTGPTIADVVGKLDGLLFTAPCSDGGTGFDCTNGASVPAPQSSPSCQSGAQKETVMNFPIGGEEGKTYNVTFKVYGIVEAKIYQNGMRRAQGAPDPSNTGGDFWYVGGTAPPSTYNTYELHVTPPVAGEANDYFLNSRPDAEGHSSWALNYSATIAVPAKGNVKFRVFDSNCRQIMNCGPGAGSSTCAAPRTIDLGSTDPKPPAGFMQPWSGGAPNGAKGQWLFIDVTKVEARP